MAIIRPQSCPRHSVLRVIFYVSTFATCYFGVYTSRNWEKATGALQCAREKCKRQGASP